MKILVTGGAGYIGSHTLIELIEEGYEPIVVDNLTNGNYEAVRRVESLTGQSVPFYKADAANKATLRALFEEYSIDGVIHFAGLKAVGESVCAPISYYRVNIDSTLSLLEVMAEYDVTKIVFSSSATVYGSALVPYTESEPTGRDITSPYGQTKYIVEQILRDAAVADHELSVSLLRYFNPIGAHPSGMIGEAPIGTPNNLMPFISQVAAGQREKLTVFGSDYPTKDGTCSRDYIHVMDLAKGHVAAFAHLVPGSNAYNIGSGQPTTVLELIKAFTKATGIRVPYEYQHRRAGDLPEFYASTDKAQNELAWRVEHSIAQACEDAWRWQSMNPNGYVSRTDWIYD